MSIQWKCRVAVLTAVAVVLTVGTWQSASADPITHAVKGVVKSVDKDSKTMVVKAGDGTEHTIKWTDKTAVEGGKDIKAGSQVSVKYTEEAGEKTATGVKKIGKTTAKAVE